MGRDYTQLTLEDRCEMARLHTTGHSLRQIAATLDRARSTVARELNRNGSTNQAMPTNKPGRAAGRAPSSTATARSAPRSWRSSNTAGPPNRWPAASLGSSTDRSSPTRPSTASSMRRWPAKQSTPGATICRRPKPNAGAVATRGAARRPVIALRRPLAERPAAVRIAVPRAIGRPI